MKAEIELAKLRSFVAQAVPYLEEAWEACFDGKEEQLLSAEQRGMGHLLAVFRAVADKKPALPPGVITIKEADERRDAAIKWATDLLGNPNDLKEPFRSFVHPGETCADGLKRAVAGPVD